MLLTNNIQNLVFKIRKQLYLIFQNLYETIILIMEQVKQVSLYQYYQHYPIL